MKKSCWQWLTGRTLSRMCCGVAAVAGWAGASLGAEELIVPAKGYSYLEGATSATVRAAVEGEIRKTGTETASLALDSLSSVNGEIVAAGGTLAVSEAEASAGFAAPSNVLLAAALWLDASRPGTVLLEPGSAENVSQWLDVRETNTAADSACAYSRVRAASYTNFDHSAAAVAAGPGRWFPTHHPAGDATNAAAYIDFGGYASGQRLRFLNSAGGVTNVSPFRQVFAVFGSQGGAWGFLFDPSGNNAVMVPAAYSLLADRTLYPFMQDAAGAGCILSGTFRIDRAAVNPLAAVPNGGYQLMEIQTGTSGWSVDGFFSHDDIASEANGYRQGGGRLCEVLAYTNVLSETERMRVETYLWRKWFSAADDAASFRVGAAGTLAIGADGLSAAAARIAGAGTVRKEGAGRFSTAEIHGGEEEDLPALSLLGGTVSTPMPVPLVAASGELAADTNGLTLEAAADGRLVKKGAGDACVRSLGANVSQVEVREGTLHFTQTGRSGTAMPSLLKGVIEDPSFEAFLPSLAAGGSCDVGTAAPIHGWQAVNGGTYVARWTPADGAYTSAANPYPDGECAGVLHIANGLKTTVTLPAAGVYQLSFWAATRPAKDAYRGHEFQVVLDGTSIVAQVMTFGNRWERFVYRLPWLAAGAHTLTLAGDAKNAQAANGLGANLVAMVDNFSVDWVSSEEPPAAVPNGSFEVCPFAYRQMSLTLPNLGGWVYGTTNSTDRVTVDTAELPSKEASAWMHRPADGRRVMTLWNKASLSVPVAFQTAGTYRLTLAAASVIRAGEVSSTRGKVKVSLGGADLGTLIVTNGIFEDYSCTFTVTGAGSLTLGLAGQASGAAVALDDFRISVLKSPVLQDTFASLAGWTQVCPNSQPSVYDSKALAVSIQTNTDVAWGNACYDDICRVGLRNDATLCRTVHFPAAGAYRVSIQAAGRFYRYTGLAEDFTRYSSNSVSLWLARDGATNELGVVGTDDAERFLKHQYLFTVPAAGDWTFGITGLGHSENGNSKGIVLDGLTIEPVTLDAWEALSKHLAVAVSAGAWLALDFQGTNEVSAVQLAGRWVSGVISAQTHPEFIRGTGALQAAPHGTVFRLLP